MGVRMCDFSVVSGVVESEILNCPFLCVLRSVVSTATRVGVGTGSRVWWIEEDVGCLLLLIGKIVLGMVSTPFHPSLLFHPHDATVPLRCVACRCWVACVPHRLRLECPPPRTDQLPLPSATINPNSLHPHNHAHAHNRPGKHRKHLNTQERRRENRETNRKGMGMIGKRCLDR